MVYKPSVVGVSINLGKGTPKRRISFRKSKTPKTFRDDYDEQISEIDKKLGKIGTPVDDDDPIHEDFKSEFEKLISKNRAKADRCWSKKSRSKSYTCAYKYGIVGYVYDKTQNLQQAGFLYHFAGHQFRHIEEYELSGKFYTWSAEVFKEAGKEHYKRAKRSYRRAQKAFESVGDNDIGQKIKFLEDSVDKDQATLEGEGLELISWYKNRGKLKLD